MLRQRRELRGMPQKELARRLSISFQQVQKYESGANRISASKLWEICRILETDPNYYFEGLTQEPGSALQLAEPAPSAYEADSASSRQVIDLNHNFQQIRDPKLRQRLVQLMRTLAQMGDEE